MNIKNLLTTTLMLASWGADVHAYEYITQGIEIRCNGSKGTFEMDLGVNYIHYKFETEEDFSTKMIWQVPHYAELKPTTNTIEYSRPERTISWFSGTSYKKKFFPGYWECAPTRAEDQCIHRFVPARWGKVYIEDISLTLKKLPDGTYLFDRIHYSNSVTNFREDLSDLGDDAVCTVATI
jgi:hypothetical protein